MSPELKEKVERLCECLTKTHERWEHTRDKVSFDYSVGPKYIRIINCEHGDHRSVWGFINKKEWSKPSGITFREGDILKSAGWKTPGLNAPRGNLFDGYRIDPNSMRIYASETT